MYKVLIAEDEHMIRKALISQMDWAAMGCVVTGETDNGTRAIGLLLSLKPDILISDIQLEGKSGIEVCQYIQGNGLSVKTVLITGFGELSYAKAAIKLDATDFILKPIDPAELEAAVRKAVAQLDAETALAEEMVKLQAVVEESLPLLKERFLLQLAGGSVPDRNELVQNMSFFNIRLDHYAVLALEIDDYGSYLDAYRPLERQALELALREQCLGLAGPTKQSCYVDFEPNCRLLVVDHERGADLIGMAEAIQENVFDKYGMSISIGISGGSTDPSRLNETVEEAKGALRHKFYSGSRSVVSHADIQDIVRGKTVSPFPYYAAVTRAVLVGNTEEARYQFHKLWSMIGHEADEAYIKNTVVEFIIVIQTSIQSGHINLEHMSFESNVYGLIASQSTVQDVRSTAEALLVTLSDEVRTIISSRNRSVVDRLLQYMNEHYGREITLKELGETVYMNPKYVSRLLKQETGENFSAMLTKIRIQKAKEMMEHGDLKVYEVAQKVGINDSRYFSQMFKKHAGVTPLDYRNRYVSPEK
ncbi:response regulator [Cohnella silvisoli]|uniref:Response regulator n=1 Tax=Cohnella silvisoli TaxID=2873699 RepID=A0ABV1KU94_9BACL|nr:response regulator [Cohnella silvisoli]MCD9023232.1 response regulator [Cohnella silvisoli]